MSSFPVKATSRVEFDLPVIALGAGKSTGAVVTVVESLRLGLVCL